MKRFIHLMLVYAAKDHLLDVMKWSQTVDRKYSATQPPIERKRSKQTVSKRNGEEPKMHVLKNKIDSEFTRSYTYNELEHLRSLVLIELKI